MRSKKKYIVTRDYRSNERIRAREVLVIGPDGEQMGAMAVHDAIRTARENDLDLVEVAPNSVPPVCRVMDFGKFKYDQAKKEREARKSQKSSSLKEVRMRTRIGDHDIMLKTRKIQQFLGSGDKVKVSVLFRGREVTHPEVGNKLLGRVARSVLEQARVEAPPSMERRIMSMILVSTKKVGQAASREPVGVQAKVITPVEEVSEQPAKELVAAKAEAPAPKKKASRSVAAKESAKKPVAAKAAASSKNASRPVAAKRSKKEPVDAKAKNP